MKEQRRLTIRDLYPEMNDAQLAEAEQNLRRYVQIIWAIPNFSYSEIEARIKAETK